MTTPTMTLNEIRQRGIEALSRELGPVGMVRFLQMFETGYSDYTEARHQWLDDQRIEDIAQRIRQKSVNGND
jgi:hypothetical protein